MGFAEIIFSAMYNVGGESCSPFLLVDRAREISLCLSLSPPSLPLSLPPSPSHPYKKLQN